MILTETIKLFSMLRTAFIVFLNQSLPVVLSNEHYPSKLAPSLFVSVTFTLILFFSASSDIKFQQPIQGQYKFNFLFR